MTKKFHFLLICLLLGAISCKKDSSGASDSSGDEKEITKYTLTPFSQSPEYLDAKITNMMYSEDKFSFDVSNYDLGAQTADAGSKMCANSGKGQHIHLIVDSLPYAAKYVNEFDHSVINGGHFLLAFLSRSYHESIKTKDAHIVKRVNIQDGKIAQEHEVPYNMVFYSRPKGTYVGKANTEKVMLDFYLVNTELSEDGFYIDANINGEIHKITKWQPYYIEGLPMGDNYISLILRNKSGDAVDVPLNPIKRIFTLKEDPTPAG